MKKVGQMWIREGDEFFSRVFRRTGDDFELDHLREAMKYVTDFSCAIDGGANYGSWSRAMANSFDSVISFEPVKANFECLQKNTDHISNITLHNEAIGEQEGKVNVGIGKRYDNVGMFTIIGDGDIPMVTIDSMNLPSLGLLKLDIEGYEYFALRGAEETIKRCTPIIIFEENIRCELEHNISQGTSGEYLEQLGAKLITRKNNDLIYGWV